MIRRITLAADSPATAAENILYVASDDGVEVVCMSPGGGPRHRAEAVVEHEVSPVERIIARSMTFSSSLRFRARNRPGGCPSPTEGFV